MPYLHQCSMYDFLRYYAEDSGEVTFVDTREKTAFGIESEQTFSLLELRDIATDRDHRFIALYTEKQAPRGAGPGTGCE